MARAFFCIFFQNVGFFAELKNRFCRRSRGYIGPAFDQADVPPDDRTTGTPFLKTRREPPHGITP
jgi:hypothetical protein